MSIELNHWSTISRQRLSTCHSDLQRLFNKVLESIDCSVICGHRDEVDQAAAFAMGRSKLKWPKGKHNAMPSRAVDVKAPLTMDQHYFAGRVMQIAEDLEIKLRWGGDWDQDGDMTDQTFNDLVHFELTGQAIDVKP